MFTFKARNLFHLSEIHIHVFLRVEVGNSLPSRYIRSSFISYHSINCLLPSDFLLPTPYNLVHPSRAHIIVLILDHRSCDRRTWHLKFFVIMLRLFTCTLVQVYTLYDSENENIPGQHIFGIVSYQLKRTFYVLPKWFSMFLAILIIAKPF